MIETTHLATDIGRQMAALSPARRALLELRLMKKNQHEQTTRHVITARHRETAPLSYHQQGLWVLNQLMPGESVYHTPTAARLTGTLNVDALTKALQSIVDRHDALRTVFKIVDGAPMQVIQEVELDTPLVDLTEMWEDQREAEALRTLRHEARRPFDLSQGPLVRSVIVRIAEDEHILLVTMHHIVTDGWSVGIFHRELSALYDAYVSGGSSPFSALPIQYPDYAFWQREWFEGDLHESQLAYWKKQFATMPPALELPADHQRPNVQAYRAFRGAQQTIVLPAALARRLRVLCQKENVTLFMLLMAAYQILLHRYTGEEDIVVGTPIAGRQMAETEELIGLFINTLAIRGNVSSDATVRDFLNHMKQVALGAYAHQDLAFEQLVKELQPERTLAHNPLFQVMFVLQSEEILPLQLSGLTAQHFRVDHVMANFDLTLDIVERNDELVCLFESNADLFEAETIGRMMTHFQNLLEGMADNLEQRISDLPLLSAAERHQLLIEWNDTESDYPSTQTIQELFEQQVAVAPDAVALICGDEKLTYRELNERANQLAHYLRDRGVQSDTMVAMCLQRSPDLIVALLGILKAGGAYVPLDPSYPAERLELMMSDSGAPLLLTEKSLVERLPFADAGTICIDELAGELIQQSKANPGTICGPDNLAYVIYTSGSTGKPKGVLVPHRSVVNLLASVRKTPGMTSQDVVLAITTVSFDIAVSEVILPLTVGAKIVLVNREVAADGVQLLRTVRDQKVTFIDATPATWRLLLAAGWDGTPGLTAICTGEAMPQDLAVSLTARAAHVWNGYGPTETTVWSSFYEVPQTAGRVLIGRPIANTALYVLGANFEPVPPGVTGELFIGGEGVTHGYHKRPELTAERFLPDPFRPGSRMYKTGDVARFLPDGNLECLGRNDNQVKLRGYRIELGEIETALMDHHAVREAVVVAQKDSGDKHLVAYLVPRNGNLRNDEVREFLRTRLPDYMVPSVFVTLESLPLSPAGKVNRRALPDPGEFTRESDKGFTAASNELELKLTRIWEQVLRVHPIGVDENFFDLGGHSLLAVKLFAEIEKSFGKNLPLATLFQAPTVRQLARVLRDEGWQSVWSSLVMIQPGGARTPFFCIHAAGGNVLEYHDLARLLGPDQPFYGLQAKGLDGKSEPHTNIKEMAAHYIKEMREIQPEGPYFLGGRSSGGTIAFEMACQLEVIEEKVTLLALLDTYPAGYFKLLPGSSTRGQRMARRMKKWRSHVTNLRALDSGDKIRYLLNKMTYAPAKAKHKIYRRAYKLYRRFGRPLPPVLQNIEEINFAAVKDFEPQVYAGDVTLFLASDLTSDYDLHDGWKELVRGKIETHEISGNHINIIKEPHVGALAAQLRECITRSEKESKTA
ncbi:MAG TPA: amino acid adenylation domain-containing protein [Pyrinomonadaceae bacterium]